MVLFVLALLGLSPGSIAGQVVDSRTGVPLGKVLIEISEAGKTAQSDENGRFVFDGVEAGRQTLYVSVVGYVLVKREVEVRDGQRVELTIPMVEGTGAYSEQVTVTASVFEPPEKSVPSQHGLGSGELQNLRGVLTDDPLRAVQVLPGVTTGDDFRSEFSVRGSDYRHIGISLDGVFTPVLLHTVRGHQESGSVAMINSDILEGAALFNGAYPQRFGNRTGAQLEFYGRSGSRDRLQTRVAVSGTSASFVLEGPLGKQKRGSWLVSARKSYLDLLVHRISKDYDFNFGFADFQSKLVYDLSDRQQLEWSVVAGRGHLEDQPDDLGRNGVREGWNRAALMNLSWKFAPGSKLLLTQRVYAVASSFRNENRDRVELDRGTHRDVAYRVDLSYTPSPAVALELGGHVQRLSQELRHRRFDFGRGRFELVDEYDDSAAALSSHAQLRWSPSPRFSIVPGVRVDRWTLVDQTTASPWLLAEWTMPRQFRLKFGTGVYRQFPDFEHISGMRGRRSLGPERADHYDVGLEQNVGGVYRWQIALYNREERRFLRLLDSEAHLVNGAVQFGSAGRYENSLRGYSRGVELLAERKSPNGLSGWISYSLGYTRYRDGLTGEAYWADYDQRHTLNLYGHYRLSDRSSLSAKFRAGSNYPIPGYFEKRGDDFFVTDQRNQTRLPVYNRLDLRANRVFNLDRSRITLFIEVLNVYNRRNQRAGAAGIQASTRQAFGVLDRLLPIVPSAGILVEF